MKEYENARLVIESLLTTSFWTDGYYIDRHNKIFINNDYSGWSINFMKKTLYIPCRFKDEIIEIRQLNEY